jgi:hypothetical protein
MITPQSWLVSPLASIICKQIKKAGLSAYRVLHIGEIAWWDSGFAVCICYILIYFTYAGLKYEADRTSFFL